MPTVLRKKGYRFFFFSSDRREPVHVHVEKGDGYAKFWLDPVALARSRGFRGHELREIHAIIEQNRRRIEKAWKAFFRDTR